MYVLQQIISKSPLDIRFCSAKKYIFSFFPFLLTKPGFLGSFPEHFTPVSNSYLFISQNSSTPATPQTSFFFFLTSLPNHQSATILEPWDQQDPLSLESNLGNIFYYKNMPLGGLNLASKWVTNISNSLFPLSGTILASWVNILPTGVMYLSLCVWM